MRKAKSLLGLKIITQSGGQDLGHVRDLIFSEGSQRLLALLLTDRELFGMIDATCVPWASVREIGPNAVMVPSDEAIIKVHAEPVIAEGYDAHFTLDGKQVTTDQGENLGRISDIYLDSNGVITGYEISGGLFSDAFNGKRYLAAPSRVTMGQDVVIVPHDVTVELQRQSETQPGGIAGVYDAAKTKISETYENVATASVEKQREYVVGKTAANDVTTGGDAPEIIVSSGGQITPEIADRAIAAGVLGSLVTAAGKSHAQEAVEAGKEKAAPHLESAQNSLSGVGDSLSGAGHSLSENAEEAAIGQPAGREIVAQDGSILVAPGMIITREVLDRANLYGKKNEVIAAAGLGAAQQKSGDALQGAKQSAVGIWETIKEKTAELTGTAQEKKAEYDQNAQERRVKNALGRPVTRVILAPDDTVILNTGDIITNRAVELSRDSGVLEILLDSVYEGTPDLTPNDLRVNHSGEAALPSQNESETLVASTGENSTGENR